MNITVNNKPAQSNLTLQKKFSGQPQQTSTPSFTGVNADAVKVASKSKFFEPVKKFFKPVSNACNSGMDKLTDGIAIVCSKIMKKKSFEKIVLKTEKANLDVVKHISAAIGVIISGLYIYKTMTNEKLEPEKRTTLSINQGIVSVVATTLGYTFDKLADKKVNKFIRKFAAVNIEDKALKSYQGGIRAAASMMIFGTMYRYVAPVLVTPIANSIGNRVQENKKAQKALVKTATADTPAPAQASKAPESIFTAKSPFTMATK